LVEHFVKRLNEPNGKKKGITNEVLQLLMRYPWPGNVRQLESVIERSYVMCEGDMIDVEHIPEEVKQERSERLLENIEIPDEGFDIEEVEKEFIKKAIKKAEGKISLAARLLNMPYDKLWFKVKKMKEKEDILDFTNK
ncbi:MAG: sigma-54-dependent Fis family transcriptional regulator, partial [Proteobacteria bacterium]|nr:sigma-54-dependent Fis family transcriptional regulator [Pseudomonadota bacterium]